MRQLITITAFLFCACAVSARYLETEKDELETLLDLLENLKRDRTTKQLDERFLEAQKNYHLTRRHSETDIDLCNKLQDIFAGTDKFVMCSEHDGDKMPACVIGSYICDSIIDCQSGEDERQPGCLKSDDQCTFEYPNGYFKCTDTLLCVDSCRVCDGICDCFDGSDESECRNGVSKKCANDLNVDTCKKP
ncbi:uncharacterized protein LOC144437852 [Glandiceps talaboti]